MDCLITQSLNSCWSFRASRVLLPQLVRSPRFVHWRRRRSRWLAFCLLIYPRRSWRKVYLLFGWLAWSRSKVVRRAAWFPCCTSPWWFGPCSRSLRWANRWVSCSSTWFLLRRANRNPRGEWCWCSIWVGEGEWWWRKWRGWRVSCCRPVCRCERWWGR